ncbi:YgeY family selenium metabolism-linked hydrolase [Desulfocurvus sp. DL9XJH121]
MYSQFSKLAEELKDDIVALSSTLIQTPSIGGTEGKVAAIIEKALKDLGYDEVFVDGIGNVVGIIKGDGTGPSAMYDSHMDHVLPGDENLWEYGPYSGEVAEGFVHGRAASDVKCGLACQIYAGHILKRLNVPLKGDYIFAAVVQEEPAEMFGMTYLLDKTFPEKGITFDLHISSEATDLDLVAGHKGRAEIEVETTGRTSHGSAPWRGINAVFKMLPILEKVREKVDTLPEDPILGKASLTLTRISCSPGELSIIPDKCTVSLDRRLVRGETREEALGEIQAIVDELVAKDPELKAEVRMRAVTETSYTGVSKRVEKYMPAWVIPEDHPAVLTCLAALKEIGQNPGIHYWDFGTDCSQITAVMGIPSIGYSPMEEKYAHTPIDRCDIEKMVKGTAGYAAIAMAYSA